MFVDAYVNLTFMSSKTELRLVNHLVLSPCLATHRHFVFEAISDLLRSKCVEILDHKSDIVNPLSVSIQPSDKKRLILDWRHVNLYVFKRKF